MKILLFDTETTDLEGYVVEIAYLVCKLKEKGLKLVRGKARALNPQAEVSSYVRWKFHINPEKFEGLPTFKDFWRESGKEFLNADLIVAHNVSFDLSILIRELKRLGKDRDISILKRKPTFCTCKDLLELTGMWKKPKLEEAVKYFNIDPIQIELTYKSLRERFRFSPKRIRDKNLFYHNALYDTVALAYVFSACYKKFGKLALGR